MIVAQTTQERDTLARSPTFAMSLGAKELFHTNFLGFLLESNNNDLEGVQKALREALGFRVLAGELSRCFVWREKKNLDLILVPVASGGDPQQADTPVPNRALVVEAKLKSIPTREQLDRYFNVTLKSLHLDNDEQPNGFHIRLSTQGAQGGVSPALVLLAPTEEGVHDKWSSISWTTVKGALNDDAINLPNDPTFAAILRDYAGALGCLLKIIEITRDFVNYACVEPEVTYGKYESELTHLELRRLRLHDLVGKIANEEWSRRLMHRIREVLPDQADGVRPYVHFTNSQPGLGFEVSAPNGFRIGVQIQGGQFRRYVSHVTGLNNLEQLMQRDELWAGWFMQTVFNMQLTGLENQPENALPNLRCFNRTKFLYSALDLRPLSLQNAENAIIESMDLAIEKTHDHQLWH